MPDGRNGVDPTDPPAGPPPTRKNSGIDPQTKRAMPPNQGEG